MESLIGVLVGIGLSAASGLRVFIPLLGMSAAGYYGLIPLNESFAWLASWQAMLAFGVASLVEVGAYYIPWLDHALDVVLAPAAAAAGTILTASTLGDISPFLKWTLAIVAGGGVSSIVHFGSSAVRAAVGIPTGGLANPIVSSGEGLGSIVLTLLALFIPVLGIIVVIWLVYRGLKRLYHFKTIT
ncbi:MAG: DUF4126 domain-containing protein [Arenimonas sp.]|nr:DUF4126 domain-containing protein [Arenimonas sp.]